VHCYEALKLSRGGRETGKREEGRMGVERKSDPYMQFREAPVLPDDCKHTSDVYRHYKEAPKSVWQCLETGKWMGGWIGTDGPITTLSSA
jgi:hypothetical protein